jgi:hypothetical protein
MRFYDEEGYHEDACPELLSQPTGIENINTSFSTLSDGLTRAQPAGNQSNSSYPIINTALSELLKNQVWHILLVWDDTDPLAGLGRLPSQARYPHARQTPCARSLT